MQVFEVFPLIPSALWLAGLLPPCRCTNYKITWSIISKWFEIVPVSVTAQTLEKAKSSQTLCVSLPLPVSDVIF